MIIKLNSSNLLPCMHACTILAPKHPTELSSVIPILHRPLGGEVFRPHPLLWGRTITFVHVHIFLSFHQLQAVARWHMHQCVCLRREGNRISARHQGYEMWGIITIVIMVLMACNSEKYSIHDMVFYCRLCKVNNKQEGTRPFLLLWTKSLRS